MIPGGTRHFPFLFPVSSAAVARVIKGGADGGTTREPIAQRVIKAHSVDARAEARQITEAARAEGLAAGRAEAGALLVAAEAAVARRAAAETPALAALATKIAGRLLGRELALRPEMVVDIVRTALAEAAGRKRITIRVAPGDRARVADALGDLAGATPGSALELADDETIPPGGCVLDTEIGRIDARLDVQLAAIAKALA